jgi:hypothetical protein
MFITASIDLTKIDKSKIVEGKKGGKYLNIAIEVKDTPDNYGNDVSITVNQSKEERAAKAKKVYLGNGKVYKGNSNITHSSQAAPANNDSSSDLPF